MFALDSILKSLQELVTIRKYIDIFANLCTEKPFVATLIAVPIVLYIGYIGLNQFGQLVKSINNMSKSRKGRISIIISVLASILISISIVQAVEQFKRHKPVLISSDIVIGKHLTLQWDYETVARDPDLFYEVQSARDQRFREGLEPEANLTQSKFLPIGRHINDTRYWRVRAVQRVNNQGETQEANGKPVPKSPWSDALKISQYENNYERIKHTRTVNVYVSDSFDQGFYKFMAGSRITGFDIELVRLIVEKLPQKMGIDGKVKLELRTLPWGDLLNAPRKGDADIIISSITKR